MLLGVADRPRLESEYTFNSILFHPLYNSLNVMGESAGQPFEKPLFEHTRSVLKLRSDFERLQYCLPYYCNGQELSARRTKLMIQRCATNSYLYSNIASNVQGVYLCKSTPL